MRPQVPPKSEIEFFLIRFCFSTMAPTSWNEDSSSSVSSSIDHHQQRRPNFDLSSPFRVGDMSPAAVSTTSLSLSNSQKRSANKQTDRQKDRQKDRQTNKQTDRQTNNQADISKFAFNVPTLRLSSQQQQQFQIANNQLFFNDSLNIV